MYEITKERILEEINTIVSKRILEAVEEIESINQSKANETKSSAGDKYETGMAMLQMEEQKANVQLAKAKELQKTLSMIDAKESHDKVQLGSLIKTEKGYFFISVGLGKLNIENMDVFTLSMVSPIGMQMKDKGLNSDFVFMDENVRILKLT